MDSTERPQYFGRDLEAMSFAVNYHRWIIREFQPHIGRRVAEVGAGIGNFTGLLIGEADTITAFEPSANMYPELRKVAAAHAGVTAVNDFFGGEEHAGPFDTVVYVNVLEHVEDDSGEALKMFRALRPGGHALVFVPALSCLYSKLDRDLGHFRRYHKPTLRAPFEHAGFEILRCSYFDLAGILPWYLAFVLLGRSISPGNVSVYDRLVVPVMRGLEGLLTPPVGKNLLLVARRP